MTTRRQFLATAGAAAAGVVLTPLLDHQPDASPDRRAPRAPVVRGGVHRAWAAPVLTPYPPDDHFRLLAPCDLVETGHHYLVDTEAVEVHPTELRLMGPITWTIPRAGVVVGYRVYNTAARPATPDAWAWQVPELGAPACAAGDELTLHAGWLLIPIGPADPAAW